MRCSCLSDLLQTTVVDVPLCTEVHLRLHLYHIHLEPLGHGVAPELFHVFGFLKNGVHNDEAEVCLIDLPFEALEEIHFVRFLHRSIKFVLENLQYNVTIITPRKHDGLQAYYRYSFI